MGDGITLSICMIVRDESPVLARCLDGVSVFADEIVIVDTGSVDDTRQIALRYTERVYDFPWIDDFSAARNASYSHATMDYVMWIDADDVVSPEDAERLKQLKKTLPPETDVVYLLYGSETDQNDIYRNSLLYRDRWVRRSLNPKWEGRLHETIRYPNGVVIYFADQICIRHCKVRVNDPDRNMRIHKLCMAEQQKQPNRDLSFLCNEYFAKGEYDAAIAAFYELSAREPFPKRNVDNALYSYIWSLKQLKRTDELIRQLLFFKEKGLVNEMLLCELGTAYLTRGELDEAEWYLAEALSTEVDYRDMAVHLEAYHIFLPCQRLSKLYVLRGEMEKAYEYFVKAEKIYPQNRSVRLNRLFFSNINYSKRIK